MNKKLMGFCALGFLGSSLLSVSHAQIKLSSVSKTSSSLVNAPKVIVCASLAKTGYVSMAPALIDYATDIGFMNHLGVIQNGKVVDVTDGSATYKVTNYGINHHQSSNISEFSSSNMPPILPECLKYAKGVSGYSLYNKNYTAITINLPATSSSRPSLEMKFEIYIVAHPNGSKVVNSNVYAQYQKTVDQYSKVFLGLKAGLFSWGRWNYGFESTFSSSWKQSTGISAM